MKYNTHSYYVQLDPEIPAAKFCSQNAVCVSFFWFPISPVWKSAPEDWRTLWNSKGEILGLQPICRIDSDQCVLKTGNTSLLLRLPPPHNSFQIFTDDHYKLEIMTWLLDYSMTNHQRMEHSRLINWTNQIQFPTISKVTSMMLQKHPRLCYGQKPVWQICFRLH